MARATNKLSAMAVKNSTKPGYYADGLGLYLQIADGGSKSWVFRYERQKQRRELGLGSCNSLSLAEARIKAAELRKMLLNGQDPFEVRRETKLSAALERAKLITFDQCAETYIDSHRSGWKNEKHVQQWENTLAVYASPIVGNLPVAAIDTALVMKILTPIWNTKTETASRVRGRIESILDWARTSGFRAGENPARWKGHLDNLLPARNKVAQVEHFPSLPWQQISTFMAALRSQNGTAARALEITILTAARSGQTRLAMWDEFDLEAKVWIAPAAHMKIKKEHRVPLAGAAFDLLKKLKKESTGKLVFPGLKENSPLSDASLSAVIRRMDKLREGGWVDSEGRPISVHGFRSTFRDWCAEITNFPNEMAEIALAHALADKVEAAYRRGDMFEKRRKMMQAWANYCAESKALSNVVPIRGVA